MKIQHLLYSLILLAIFSGCSLVPAAPAPAQAVPPTAGQASTAAPGATETASPTPTITPTATETLTETPAPTVTATTTPAPTHKSPYPVGLETPLPDIGFPPIDLATVPNLTPVFIVGNQNIWQSAASADGKQLFTATSNGMVVYDRQGKQVAYWDTVMTYDMTCESCLSINSDGSRFVVATRKDGGWKAQVYNVVADKVYLLYEQAISSTFLGKASEVRVALSPDGLLLAYGAGDGDTSVLDLNSLQPAFHYAAKGVTGLAFTPDGVSFMARRGRDMLFWKTAKWGIPVNVLLPGDDTPYAFSPDGKLLAIAASAGPRIYHLDTLKPGAEINFPPTGTTNRLWQLSFSDATTLHAYGVRWNAAYTSATVDQGQWNAETGEQLKTDTSTTDTIDALSALWGTAIQSSSPPGDVEIGQYRRLAFVSHDTLLVAGIHTACWLKLSSGDKTCFFDGQNAVVTSDVGTYHEVLQTNHTVLQDWNGGKAFEVSPYRILALNKNADYVVINVKDATTDIYFRTKNKLVQSLPGTLSTFTEFGTRMALATNKSGVGYVTLIDEGSIAALFQKKDQHFLKPIAIDAKSNVYTLQAYPDQAQVVLGMISGPDYQLTVVGHLPMPAQPEIMALCGVTGLFAIGMDDGSVLLVSPDGKQTALFQAAHSPIGGLAFIGDGRYLAVGSAEGVKVFAILPQ